MITRVIKKIGNTPVWGIAYFLVVIAFLATWDKKQLSTAFSSSNTKSERLDAPRFSIPRAQNDKTRIPS